MYVYLHNTMQKVKSFSVYTINRLDTGADILYVCGQ